ncbi:membrane protein [Actinoplanes sp. SE50]|uniref:cytochrome c oxidase assembly protein n=1 Tax=unclassified Actinoplanes TaxID=2626549 RepID=UPI00023ED473|nr:MULTISPECIES: cytochrome c oxidase assembly protein [unclassified Actinoplanes]AEV85611.1 uncharacterized protein ACPL_4720 [Actinoplanes sp. SE50/110]ATO84004.1 membrane protein [Actinoplanes sp. SE50]SLM01414.1 membrane protein [Actinoplanes sp. SE50/110]
MTAALLVAAAVAYLAAVRAGRRRGRGWADERTACWLAGLTAAGIALIGPVAAAGHHDFAAHAAGHLLLGMAAPLLLVLAAPVTLAFRALPARWARRLARALRSRPVRVVTHPVTAAVLDAGGLWLLYGTGLLAGRHPGLVQLHILGAGYLFAAAVVGVDPAPHRPGRAVRAAALIGFLTAHAILAKFLYAHPPAGVLLREARTGAEVMYYGGDLIDLALIVIFWWQWYRAGDSGRRWPRPPAPAAWRLPAERPMPSRSLASSRSG